MEVRMGITEKKFELREGRLNYGKHSSVDGPSHADDGDGDALPRSKNSRFHPLGRRSSKKQYLIVVV
jgi:hypothetical protein